MVSQRPELWPSVVTRQPASQDMIPIICESNNNNNIAKHMSDFSEYDKFFSFTDQELSNQSDVNCYHNTSEELFETSEGESSLNMTPPPVDVSSCYSLPSYTYTSQSLQPGQGQHYNNIYYENTGTLNYESHSQHSPAMETFQQTPAPATAPAPGKTRKGKGGRKKNLYPPTVQVVKHRRNMANARERRRMNGLNDAFDRLREVVPNVNSEQKMSKIETLLVAQTYIKALAKLMDSIEDDVAPGDK